MALQSFSVHGSITTGGNVGIGTGSPTSLLELAGDSGGSVITLKRTNASNGGAKGGIRFTENTNGYNVSTIACIGDGANTSGALCFYTKASSTTTGPYLGTSDERMRISSSGDVGIGTTSPDQKLHIEDSTNPRILIENTDGTLSLNQDIGSIIFKQNDNSLTGTGTIGKIRMSSVPANDGGNFYGESADMIFSVGKFANDNANIDALTIEHDGHIGIGTTTVDAPLHIFKTAATASDIGAGIKLERWDNYGCSIWSQFHGSVDCMNFRTVSNATDAYGGTPQMVLTHEGRLGIGTTSPDLELHVHDANATNSGIILSSTSGYHRLYDSSGQLYIQSGTAASADSRADINFTSMYASTSYMKILGSNGNVGIGNASPGQKLDVSGRGRFTNNGGSLQLVGIDHTYLEYYPDGTGAGRKAWSGFGSATNDNFTIHNDAGSGHIILGGGNVGIGTNAPGCGLHIGPRNYNHLYLASNNNLYGWKFDTVDNGGGDVPLHISQRHNGGDTTVMALKQGGNVGIGTATPAASLHVHGGNIGLGYGNAIVCSPHIPIASGGWPSGTNKLIETGWGSGDEVRFFTPGSQSGTQKMVINSYGNVGIGTSTHPDTRNRGGLHLANSKGISFAASTNSNGRHWRLRSDDYSDHGSLQFGVSDNNSTHPDAQDEVVMTMDRNRYVGLGAGAVYPRANLQIGDYIPNNWGSNNTIPSSNMGHSATFPSSTKIWMANRATSTEEDYWGCAMGVIWDGPTYIQSINKKSTAVYNLLLQPNGGSVGIGTTSPNKKFHVNGHTQLGGELVTDNRHYAYNGVHIMGDWLRIQGTNGIYWENYGGGWYMQDTTWVRVYNGKYLWVASGVLGSSYRIGAGTSGPKSAMDVYQGNSISFGGNSQQLGDSPGLTLSSSGGKWGFFLNSNNDLILVGKSGNTGNYYGVAGYVLKGNRDNLMNFTGQHRSFVKDIPFTQIENKEGLIVSADQNEYIKMSGGAEAGSNAITINESLPVVSLSRIANDKKCFGVISASEDPDSREERHGNWVSVSQKEDGDTRIFINSVGEGAIWVTNINGPLESGDYITTSNIVGYGMKQDSEFLANYTVAKITMDCDFNPETKPVRQIIKRRENVNYWITTKYVEIADEEEYLTLPEDGRRTIEKPEDGSTVYQRIERYESKKEEEGGILEVREELVNVLDEHGQLQWEDHPTDTEKVYKIRYLTTDGTQTDEANAVHIAAFVGCTYHCG